MINVNLNDREQVVVTDGGDEFAFARTISASDPHEMQLEALEAVLTNVGERIADAVGLPLTGYDFKIVKA